MVTENDPSAVTTNDSNRRRFLQVIGAAGIVGIAGCLGDDDDDPADDTDDTDDSDVGDDGDDEEPTPGEFTIDNLDPSELDIELGDAVTVSADVENVGDEESLEILDFLIDGQEFGNENVQLAGGDSTTVTFEEVTVEGIEEGDYEFGIYGDTDEATGTISIEDPSVFYVEDNPDVEVDIFHDDAGQVGRYKYEYDTDNYYNTFKPFLHIWEPEVDAPITHGPRDQDVQFAHHRGIFIGWDEIVVDGNIDVDNWHTAPTIYQEFNPDLDTFDQNETITAVNHWLTDEDGDHFITETREMRFREPQTEDGIVIVDCTFTLDFEMETFIDGDPEHGGIQFRANEDMDDDRVAQYRFPADMWDWDEHPGQGQADQVYGYRWVAMEAVMHDQDYFITILNHPDNEVFDETTVSAYRDYGRFGFYWEEYTGMPGDSLTVDYRFIIERGHAPDGQADTIEEWWDQYVDEV